MIKDLLTKNGIAVTLLSRELLSIKKGERILTIGEYSKKFDLGRGTIQSAIKYLEDNDAIKLDPRGHLGTFVENINYKKLWDYAGLPIISGVMPLPYSKRYEGLATGIYKAFERENIPFNMAYMRGSERRIDALENGKYDFAILSMLAAKLNIEAGRNIKIVTDFGLNTYVGAHKIIFAENDKEEIENGMRVALDPTSIDHFILTCYECQDKEVEFVEQSYNQIISNIINKSVDAAIWNYDEIEDRGLSIKNVPLKNKKTKELNEDNTKAVLVVLKDNWGIDKIIERFVNKKEVIDIQRKVLLNEIFPEY
ncbi:hypothetical protein BFT35_11930 [Thermoanaerobacterium thermosaccharolyticum]|uniref:Transcriptional regulator n=1 Tax=Thermoanaerobacterium thermosaccharolyticum (strain ATCC 7956 / DSM 571 / NCIMB 9385 / NCA 3814 / NCTC 13789 / WDCM 00135 / 2032) TaxID=580327 RepID=D9TQG7_THETC|nr:GntR family transcriptional regulator YhfZ [Thermoanaerobacterium thermosaccharolyticum]ADL69201.1 conserved hypothetical protein [Thermoanaerobacterium thermosaccharolyticum DSM 571]PHO06322.1 hypothetical protein BFT35_11930 [Thermoanaerobacterium thermosaccharolyticum]